MNKERICLSPETLNLGGIGRVMLNLSEQFLAQGIAVDFFLSKAVGPYLEQLSNEVRVFTGNGTVKSSLLPFIRYLRQEKPTAVIASHPHVNVMNIVAAKLARVPTRIIITIHVVTSTHNEAYKSLYTSIIELLTKRIYPWADNIVAVSEAVANDLAPYMGIPRERIEVIYNPVVTQKLFMKAQESPKHPWFEETDVPIILCLGRLTKQKDFPTLVRAFAQLRQSREARLVLLGEGEDRAALERLVRELKIEESVDLPGYVANPFAYIARAAVVVLSSAWEGLPTVLIEALALGTPVVSTDCPGGSKEILEGGKYGPLVPIGDVEGLARAILASLEHEPDRDFLRARGREFSVQKATDRYLQLIQAKCFQKESAVE